MERVENLREVCSSVTAVQMTSIFIEAWCLQREVLPIGSAFEIPSLQLFGYKTPSVPFGLPSFLKLVGADFWSTTILWSVTSIIIPLLVSYFFNLSSRSVRRHGTRATESRYQVDPLTFNIAKAIATFFVYGMPINPLVPDVPDFKAVHVRVPFVDKAVAARVNKAMFYGWKGVVMGSFVGIVTALYEAAQSK